MALEVPEILTRFQDRSGRFEREAVESALARQVEVTPGLLGIVEDTIEHAVDIVNARDSEAHLYALLLLAQFREQRAYPLVIRLAELEPVLMDRLCGEFITEDLGSVTASICGNDLRGIQSVIENEEVYEWVRGAMVGGLLTLVGVGERSRDEVVAYFSELFNGRLERKPSNVWDELAACACDLWPGELMPEIQNAFNDGLVDPGFIGGPELEAALSSGKKKALARLAADPRRQLINNAVSRMEWWACFKGDAKGHAGGR